MTNQLSLNQISISKYKLPQQKKPSEVTFTSNAKIAQDALFTSLSGNQKIHNVFIKSQENLKVTRFFQDLITNWVPKLVFLRSLAEFVEMTFLEFTESALFYFAPELFGKFFRKQFSKLNPKHLKDAVDKQVTRKASDIIADKTLEKDGIGKRALAKKAGIILACFSAIPAGEYALSFAKNLLTLNVFKQSDFNNIVNLNKNKEKVENTEHQEKVRKSANKHIKEAGLVSLAGLAGGILLTKHGHKSNALQKLSSYIIQPGAHISSGLNKIGVKSQKLDNFLKKYITPEFDLSGGKLGLSKGQLLISTVAGFFGYSQAGKDRGRLDQLEVLTRVPFVVFYTVFGSSLFDAGFKRILHNVKGKDGQRLYQELIEKNPDKTFKNVPSRTELPDLARKIAKEKGTDVKKEFASLLKKKAFITFIPYAFSLVFMGFLLAGINRLWTQYRFNKAKKEGNENILTKKNTETENKKFN